MKRALLLLPILAAACGSSKSHSSAPPDTTPPTVLTRTPSPGAAQVWVHDPIVVTFSEPMDAATIVDAAVDLVGTGSTVLAKSLSLDPGGTRLTITPTAAPAAPNTITVTLHPTLTDVAGNPLTIPGDAWTFTCPKWLDHGGALSASSGTTPGDLPWISVDALGHATVGWVESDGTADSWQMRHWNGGSWDDLGAVSAVAGASNVYQGAHAIDSQGRVVAAIAELDPANNHVNMHVLRRESGSWVPLGGMLTVGGQMASFDIAIAIDSQDNPFLAWPESASGAVDIQVQHWNGSSWAAVGGALSATSSLSSDALEPSLALDAADKPVVAWAEDSGSGVTQVFVQLWNGSNWVAVGSGPLSDTAGKTSFSPSLALDSTGKPIVAFAENDGSLTNVFVQKFDGLNWTTLGGAQDGAAGTTFVYKPRIALDASDAPFLTWYEDDTGGGNTSVYAKHWNGTGWDFVDTGKLDGTGSGGSATWPIVATDPLYGSPVFAWTQAGATVHDIYVWHRND
jgi:hypothetical protein